MWYIYIIIGIIILVYGIIFFLIYKNQKEKKVKYNISKSSVSTNIVFGLPKHETSISYDDLLKSPRWLDKRNIILERDHHKCCYCGSTYNLQVHHKYYSKYPNGKKVDPWNYSNDALITLCDKCHKKVHQRKTIKVYYRKYDN